MILDTFNPEFPRRTTVIHVKNNQFYRKKLLGDAIPYGTLFVTVGADICRRGEIPAPQESTGFYITQRDHGEISLLNRDRIIEITHCRVHTRSLR
jgi:hypothetical protein